MKTIDNINEVLKDNLKVELKEGSKLSIAAACFSIYAFQELKKELQDIEELRFLFTSPTFTTEKEKKEKREFYIPRLNRERSLYGTEFEVKLRNELSQKAIAKECAEWIRQKATFKSNVTQQNMMGFITANDVSYAPINGFTSVELGCERGNNAYTMIQKMESPFSDAYVKAPIISTFHVTYDSEIKNPKITAPASTIKALKYATDRCQDDMKSVIAAVIKQILHIGTDLYTPKGIQLPGANLILSNTHVEELTKYISTGDVVKAGTSASLSILINFLIATVHNLMYDETKYNNRNVYNVKTRKIIMYSNTIASTSNLVWVGANMAAGNEGAVKDLDIGGLIVTINRLLTDTKFIQKVKEEFVIGGFNKLIQGEELQLKEVKLWD